jgi:hypothetical protein
MVRATPGGGNGTYIRVRGLGKSLRTWDIWGGHGFGCQYGIPPMAASRLEYRNVGFDNPRCEAPPVRRARLISGWCAHEHDNTVSHS